jgi:hypothetical protein
MKAMGGRLELKGSFCSMYLKNTLAIMAVMGDGIFLPKIVEG